MHKCDACNTEFQSHSEMLSHKCPSLQPPKYSCEHCDYEASRKYHLKRHCERNHSDKNAVPSKKARISERAHDIALSSEHRFHAAEKTALGRRLRTYRVAGEGADPELYINDLNEQLIAYVESGLKEHTGIKLQVVLSIKFFKSTDTNANTVAGFYSQQMPIFRGTDYNLADIKPKIMSSIDKFQRQGSGWVIETIQQADVHLIKYHPLKGSTFSEVPLVLRRKKAIVNVKNRDCKCFTWSILAFLHPTEDGNRNHNRVSNYKIYENELNFDGIEFPVMLADIEKFERQNGIAINVYGFEKELHPLRISRCEASCDKHIHLLLYDGHYSLIKDLNRLLHDQRNREHRLYFCPRCLIPKPSEHALEEHLDLCRSEEPTKVKMPRDAILEFRNIHKMQRQPLVVYADFECITEKVEESSGKTTTYQRHIPCGYGLVEAHSCCGKPAFTDKTVVRNEKAVEKFLIDIAAIAVRHQNALNNQKPMILDNPTAISNVCHICEKPIDGSIAMDHCHICGKFRGATHPACNQGYRLNRDIVVVFHNLRRYDGHLIMQEIGEKAKLFGYEIDVVAKAMEDYISFSLRHKKETTEPGEQQDHPYSIRFIDSVQFLNSSLDVLASNVKDEDLTALRQSYPRDRDFQLLRRKGVYPYDYMDSMARFNETSLPSQEDFYSRLNDQQVSDEDYSHACDVWNNFEIQNLGQYHDLYLECDVLLLADVFEEFRRLSLEKYKLDPCHYLTAPSLTWDACLRKTKVQLELLTDPDMYLFCERGIRGGISQISHRLAEANNPYIDGYDPNDLITFIIYLDANNLYGHSMSQKLPTHGFRWLSQDEIASTNFSIVDGDDGYFLEVDLDYPVELHDSHNDYPLAPEPMEIKTVSDYSQSLIDKLGLKMAPQTKLILHLGTRKNYVVHCRILKLYVDLGLVVTKIHRVLAFQQRAWLKEYIDLNTQMRTNAKSSFEKDLFKLMNNSVFGKTMENVRKYKDVELVNSDQRLEKLAAKPRFHTSCRFNDHLVGVAMLNASCNLCKPIYCGLAVLDLSKELMYRFHYEYVRPKYGDRAKLLFTDTDSLCYHIQTDDIYADMKADNHLFDFSDYPEDHPNYYVANKKVIGKMKDETNSLPIAKFCGLRSKMYSLKGPGIDKKRAKGIKKNVVQRMDHEEYVETLREGMPKQHSMNLIRSHLHNIHSETVRKCSLSPYDDKRWLLNSVESRAHFHYLNQV